jgi:hypothetical protein
MNRVHYRQARLPFLPGQNLGAFPPGESLHGKSMNHRPGCLRTPVTGLPERPPDPPGPLSILSRARAMPG